MADPLDAARALLPWWVVWSPLLAAPLAAALVAPVAAATWLWARRRLAGIPAGVHWTERARAVWPVRRTALLLAMLLPVSAAPLVVVGGAIAPIPWGVRLALVVGAALTVSLGAAFAIEGGAVRPFPARARLRSLAAWLLVTGTGWVAAIAYLVVRLGPRDPWETAVAAICVAGCAIAPVGRLLARGVRLLRPAGARVTAAVARASAAAGRPAPLAYEAKILSANALALVFAGAVVVTDGALDALDDEGLAAVMAHEVHHLHERWSVKATRAVNAAIGPAILVVVGGGHLLRALPFVWIAWFSWLLLSRRLLRRAEVGADAAAQADGAAYARALEAIYERNLVPAHHRRPLSHPHLYERLVAAGVPPAWPRPAPPAGAGAALVAVLVAAALVAGGVTGGVTFGQRLLHSEHPLLAVAVGGGAYELTELGTHHLRRGDVEGALTLYRGAERLHPDCPDHPATIAYAYALSGRCGEGLPHALRALQLDGGTGRVDAWIDPYFQRCGDADGFRQDAGPTSPSGPGPGP
jgi:Zn-dependent protease with chaperone function